MTFDPRNILIIDFGQLGDVVMSLPALRAVRERFRSRASPSPSANLPVRLSTCRATPTRPSKSIAVAIRDGFKPLSILKILDVVKDVRRRQFDFVIDCTVFQRPTCWASCQARRSDCLPDGAAGRSIFWRTSNLRLRWKQTIARATRSIVILTSCARSA
jgi:ADP-heptose:LPS heptosyltransferase